MLILVRSAASGAALARGLIRTGTYPTAANAPLAVSLKLQTALAGRVGQRLDAAVIAIVSAIERRLGDAFFLGDLGQRLPTAWAALMLPP